MKNRTKIKTKQGEIFFCEGNVHENNIDQMEDLKKIMVGETIKDIDYSDFPYKIIVKFENDFNFTINVNTFCDSAYLRLDEV